VPDGDHVVARQVEAAVVGEEVVDLVLLSVLGCEVLRGDWLVLGRLTYRLLSRDRIDQLLSDLSHDVWALVQHSCQRRRVDLEVVLDRWDLLPCHRCVELHTCSFGKFY
jgi:hypothetical protein